MAIMSRWLIATNTVVLGEPVWLGQSVCSIHIEAPRRYSLKKASLQVVQGSVPCLLRSTWLRAVPRMNTGRIHSEQLLYLSI